MGVFGPLLQSAQEFGRGMTTMYRDYRAAYAQLGREAPPVGIQEMNVFRQGLGRVMRSAASLSPLFGAVNAGLQPGSSESEIAAAARAQATALTSEHMAPPVGYEPLPTDFANPTLLFTFRALIDTPEGVVERWSSTNYDMVFPETFGQLYTEALAGIQGQLDAAAMEEGEQSPTAGGTVTGLSDGYLLAKGV